MRLWHPYLINKLPRQQLLGQHRECCALRGLGWGRKHATVDYVFRHPYLFLYIYHYNTMEEMESRGYEVDDRWFDPYYRGKRLGYNNSDFIRTEIVDYNNYNNRNRFNVVYPEHNISYLGECIENLRKKEVMIDIDIEIKMQLELLGFNV